MSIAPLKKPATPDARRRWAQRILLLVVIVVVGAACVPALRQLWAAVEPEPRVMASLQAQLQPGQPAEGWRYLWNAGGELGQSAHYEELKWNGNSYSPEGRKEYPQKAPARYLKLVGGGGHCGNGSGQGLDKGNNADRYVIVAHTVRESGSHRIIRSSVVRRDGMLNGSIDLRVFVNDREIGRPLYCRDAEGIPFDRKLGRLKKGDTIYVAVGPNEIDMNDSFGLDFSIAR